MPTLFGQAEVLIDHETKTEILKTALNYGFLGLGGLILLGFFAIVLYVVFLAIRSLFNKHLPGFFDDARAAFNVVRDSQTGIAQNQTHLVSAVNELKTLAAQGEQKHAQLVELAKRHGDPLGDDWRDHVFSSTRVESFLLELIDLGDWFLKREDDIETKRVVADAMDSMRSALQRQLNKHPKK